ncbi:linear amide C-N hydrolase [Lactiplantibacillus daowaiensis]|uniref:Linear amide C-N hydrolase n=1 Tax=Lactiplantibacillus daowaiensis TaxID=2559918 RepID=A0ABW1S2W0_9LACO|nr:linear amide C-N hydrolase [Lactiplantibacillus daowaiensis]
MCTSFTYQSSDHHHFFARTMDFPTTTTWQPLAIAAGSTYPTGLGTTRTGTLAWFGGGRHPQTTTTNLMADGINSTGLVCAELTLPQVAHYAATPVVGHINLTPQAFINWVLSEHTSLAQVIADLSLVTLIDRPWVDHQPVSPFHWLLTDSTGMTVVIEPTGGPLHAIANPSGILTNTPVLATHLANLNQLVGLTGDAFTPQTQLAIQAYCQTHAVLPTGTIPTTRFLHTALRRWGRAPQTASNTIPTLLNWLDEVSLPVDATKQQRPYHHDTHYQSIIDLTNQTYYFRDQKTRQLQVFQLCH